MKFDPRYAILAILLILAVYKITKKEPYMCGGKREGYKSPGGPKFERKPPIMGSNPIKKEGYCAKCGAGGQTYGKPCNKCPKSGTEGYCSSCGN